MKKSAAILLIAVFILLLFCGCDNRYSNFDSVHSYVENTNTIVEQSLKFYCQECTDIPIEVIDTLTIQYNENFYEIVNENYVETFLEFINGCNVVESNDFNTEKVVYYISLNTVYKSVGIWISSDDMVEITGNNFEEKIYYKKGLYKEFEHYLTPIIQQCDKTFYVKYLPGKFMYDYAIYDKIGNTLECDTISRCPHISLRDNDVVCIWVQGGTGSFTRGTTFYDTDTGRKSPVYSGVVDTYQSLVANTSYNNVTISDMFTGDVLQIIDEFEKDLANWHIETITDVNFIRNGTYIEVWYWTNDSTEVSQIFKLELKNN